MCPAPGGVAAVAGASAKSWGNCCQSSAPAEGQLAPGAGVCPRLPSLRSAAGFCNPGSGFAPAAAKASGCWPGAHGGGCDGGLQPACSPLLRSLCWASALGLTTVPPTGTDAKPVGKLGAGELAPTSPRDAASLEGGVPSASLAGAMQTGWLQRSRRS